MKEETSTHVDVGHAGEDVALHRLMPMKLVIGTAELGSNCST